MSIPVQCACGMKLKAKDESAGKRLKCPGCGAAVQVPMPAAPVSAPKPAPAASAYPTRRKPQAKQENPRFAISGKMITFIALLVIVPTVIYVFKAGPVRASEETTKLAEVAHDEIQDAVNRVLQDRRKRLNIEIDDVKETPHCRTLVIDRPVMPFRVPEKLAFQGTSTEGKFFGDFYTRDHRMELRIDDYDGQVINAKTSYRDGQLVIDSATP